MPRTKKENQQITDERINNILSAALYLFSLFGYKAVGMDDIAKKANCSRTLVYYYFPKKEMLFHELMKRIRKSLFSVTYDIDYNKDTYECLLEIITRVLKYLDESSHNASTIRLVLNLHLQGKEFPKPPIAKNEIPIGKQPLHNVFYYLIDRGMKEGSIEGDDPKEYVIIFLSLIEGLAYNKMYLNNKFICPKPDKVMNIIIRKGI